MSEKIDLVIFDNSEKFREWLVENHETSSEIWLGFYKIKSGRKSINYQEALDQALCFGWIDGVRKSIDSETYTNRFTPRKKSSNWSNINIEKFRRLQALGLLHKSGIEAFEKRDHSKSNTYSFENELKTFETDQLTNFKSNEIAWNFFEKQAPSYKKTCIHWINSAKMSKTKSNRLKILIEASFENRKLF